MSDPSYNGTEYSYWMCINVHIFMHDNAYDLIILKSFKGVWPIFNYVNVC